MNARTSARAAGDSATYIAAESGTASSAVTQDNNGRDDRNRTSGRYVVWLSAMSAAKASPGAGLAAGIARAAGRMSPWTNGLADGCTPAYFGSRSGARVPLGHPYPRTKVSRECAHRQATGWPGSRLSQTAEAVITSGVWRHVYPPAKTVAGSAPAPPPKVRAALEHDGAQRRQSSQTPRASQKRALTCVYAGQGAVLRYGADNSPQRKPAGLSVFAQHDRRGAAAGGYPADAQHEIRRSRKGGRGEGLRASRRRRGTGPPPGSPERTR